MSSFEVTRRAFLGALGAAGVVGVPGSADASDASPGDDIGSFLDRNAGEGDGVRIPPGTYRWDGSGLDVDTTVAGAGTPGDVVLELQSGSMDGYVRGTLENVVVRGANPEPKAGIDLHPGGVIDGFCWPEGGGENQDRGIYHPSGGRRTTIRNTCVAGMANNGAYVDKAPVTVDNCAFLNNNVANLRVGHSDGSYADAVSYIRNSLVAVTNDIRVGNKGLTNPIGLRILYSGRFFVEDSWFVFTEGAPSCDGLVELRGEGITVEFRNCHFHNDTANDVVRDTGSDNQVTFSNCTVSGEGRTAVSEPSVSGSLARDTVQVPLPSGVTGVPQANKAYGFELAHLPSVSRRGGGDPHHNRPPHRFGGRVDGTSADG